MRHILACPIFDFDVKKKQKPKSQDTLAPPHAHDHHKAHAVGPSTRSFTENLAQMLSKFYESDYKLVNVKVRSPIRGKIMVEAKIGLSTLYCLNLPFEKMTRLIVKAETAYLEIVDEGFHALNERRVKILDELAASYNLKYTVHAPFADINIASPSRPILKAILTRLKKSIIHASELDCNIWVFHPGLKTGISMFYPEEGCKQNLKTIRLLFRFAKEHGVKAALENVPEPFPFLMKSVEDFHKFYSEIDEEIG